MSNKWSRVGKRDKFTLNMELDHSWVAQKAMEAAEKAAGVAG